MFHDYKFVLFVNFLYNRHLCCQIYSIISNELMTFTIYVLWLHIWLLDQKVCCCCWVTKSCLTLLRPPWTADHKAPSVCGISQAKILEWVAISLSRGSSWPRDQTCVSCIGRRILYHRATPGSSFNFANCYQLLFKFVMPVYFFPFIFISWRLITLQ